MRKGLRGIFFLAGFFVLALIVRLLNFRLFLHDGIFRPASVDGYYHLRRIFLILSHYPWVPRFDSYIAYPYGADPFWPPLFDWLVASLALLIGGGAADEYTVGVVSTFLPPIIGALTVIPVYFFARRLRGEVAALFAVLLYAVLPGAIAYGSAAFLEYHILEALLPACFFCAMAVKRSDRWAVAAGVFLGLAFLTWSGCTVFIFIFLLYLFCSGLYGAAMGRMDDDLPRRALIALLVCLVIIIPYSLRSCWVVRGKSPYIGLSYSHIFVVAVAALFPAVLLFATRSSRLRRVPKAVVVLGSAALTAAVGLVGILVFPDVAAPLGAYFGYVRTYHPWLKFGAEGWALFEWKGKFSTKLPEVCLSRAIFLLPIPLLMLAAKTIRRKAGEDELMLLVWGGALSAFVMVKQRFIIHFVIPYCVLMSLLAFDSLRYIGGKLSARGRVALGVCSALMALLLFVPCLNHYLPEDWLLPIGGDEPPEERRTAGRVGNFFGLSAEYVRFAPRYGPLEKVLEEMLAWMRKETPPTSYYDNPTRKPEYGVLSHWFLGYLIEYLGRRPVLSNPHGTDLGYPELFVDSVRFYLLRDEAEAVRILEKYGVRYIVTLPPFTNLRYDARVAGIPEEEFLIPSRDGGPPKVRHSFYYRIMGSRLHHARGCMFMLRDERVELPPLRRFRLVYERPPDAELVKGVATASIKVFEFVKGAKLRGKVRPRQRISLSLYVMTNWRATFEYRDVIRADDEGNFSVTVPYPTVGSPYRTHAITPYRLSFAGGVFEVSVTERDVMEGRTVEVR